MSATIQYSLKCEHCNKVCIKQLLAEFYWASKYDVYICPYCDKISRSEKKLIT